MTQVSLGGWGNVFRAYRRACTLGVYVCVCVYTVRCKSSSSPSDYQTVLLQLRAALLLLFLPWLTLQVLSSLSSPPSLLPRFFFFSSFPAHILLLFLPRVGRLGPSAAVLPTFFEFMPTKRMTDNPTWRDRPLTPSLTPCSHWPLPRQRSDCVGLPTSCLVSQTVILRVCFVGMTLGTCMGVCACIVTFVCMVCFLWMSAG